MLKKIKKVQTKIIAAMLMVALLVAVVLGISSAFATRISTQRALEDTLLETADIASSDFHRALMELRAFLEEVVASSDISNADASDSYRLNYLKQRAEANDFLDAMLLDVNGVSVDDGTSYAREDWYTSAMQEGWGISLPLHESNKQDMYFYIASPVMIESTLHGVAVFKCDQQWLQDIISEIRVGESDNADVYVLGGDGVTVASLEYDLVVAQENLVAQADAGKVGDGDLALAEVERMMVGGKHDVQRYSDGDGVNYIQSFSPIDETDGWSVAVVIDEDEFMNVANAAVAFNLIVTVILVLVAFVMSKVIGTSIGAPIVAVSKRLESLTKGDLHSVTPEVDCQDEVRLLRDNVELLVGGFNAIIQEVESNLVAIARGDLTRLSDPDLYPGDFKPIYESLTHINVQLNRTMSRLDVSAEKVLSGSQQVSGGAQQLAQGATEQASAVEELSEAIHEIAEHTNATATSAENARGVAAMSVTEVTDCNMKMNRLLEVMEEISTNSSEINKIIGIIDNITFQTNILALNAAVEAARAGVAGKGFAVVASEVRNLAAKTAESSKNITPLITASVNSAKIGGDIATETAAVLETIVKHTQENADALAQIVEASSKQSHAIQEVNDGINQIAVVSTTNSATAEESAATSIELSEQANELKTLVGQFKLKR